MPDQTKYTTKLAGSRVLIIGGSSGIGFGAAEACVENGALVAISSSNPDRISKAVARLQEAYPSASKRIWGLKVDLGNQETLESELKGLLENAVETMGGEKLDHVVYTAGDALAQIGLADMVSVFFFEFFLSSIQHTTATTTTTSLT